jgi:hypothetical protein
MRISLQETLASTVPSTTRQSQDWISPETMISRPTTSMRALGSGFEPAGFSTWPGERRFMMTLLGKRGVGECSTVPGDYLRDFFLRAD